MLVPSTYILNWEFYIPSKFCNDFKARQPVTRKHYCIVQCTSFPYLSNIDLPTWNIYNFSIVMSIYNLRWWVQQLQFLPCEISGYTHIQICICFALKLKDSTLCSRIVTILSYPLYNFFWFLSFQISPHFWVYEATFNLAG